MKIIWNIIEFIRGVGYKVIIEKYFWVLLNYILVKIRIKVFFNIVLEVLDRVIR